MTTTGDIVQKLWNLCHTSTADRRFWGALGRLMPDYEVRKARLKALGPRLVW